MGQDGLVEPEDAGEARLAGSQPVEQVAPDLGLDGKPHVAAGAQGAQRRFTGCGFAGGGLAWCGWTHATDTTSPVRAIAPPPGIRPSHPVPPAFGWNGRGGGDWWCEATRRTE
ncbi:hypothetical protein GCM10010187_42930 [Actinomadura coerulea]|nr:hypothetical protein GCM10010187_42930 [Actinomadura coerulea]